MLTQERILQSALELIDEEGIGGLSLRKIATRLGASTMSLYRHFRSKADIEVALVDHVVGYYDVTNHDEADWLEWLQRTFSRMREGLCAHPGLMGLLDNAAFTTSYRGRNALQVMDTILCRLRAAGFAPQHAAALYHMLMAYTIGSVVLMNQEMRRVVVSGGGSGGEDERPAEYSQLLELGLQMVGVQQFKGVAEMAPQLATLWEPEAFRAAVLHITRSFLATAMSDGNDGSDGNDEKAPHRG
ncbi:hypothetical protein ACY05_03640 [Sterolibacterium denitrificans]|uniref:HTH tetR-type domain-containing protein n=1 Tax=Sterolibacterium denitrificans TaxID=157592 RepID=A0A656Z776_9PROT|nr:hypothetical protein ACY05_03640 [Sterolibacterium denitrificans]